MTKEQRIEELLEYAICHLNDIIPYDTPNYEKVLQEEAKHFAEVMYEWETNPQAFKDMFENTETNLPILDIDLPF